MLDEHAAELRVLQRLTDESLRSAQAAIYLTLEHASSRSSDTALEILETLNRMGWANTALHCRKESLVSSPHMHACKPVEDTYQGAPSVHPIRSHTANHVPRLTIVPGSLADQHFRSDRPKLTVIDSAEQATTPHTTSKKGGGVSRHLSLIK